MTSTDRDPAEEKLRKSEERYRSLVQDTTEAIFCFEFSPPIPTNLPIDEQVRRVYLGTLADCNVAAARTYGWERTEEVLGKTLSELTRTRPGDHSDERYRTFVRAGYHMIDGEDFRFLPDGSKRWFSYRAHGVLEAGQVVRVWGAYRDITDRKRAEEERLRLEAELQHSQKLESLGVMAAGIAHDFNNILGAIFGFASLLREDLAENPEQRRFVERILLACESGKGIIAEIRTFARAERAEHRTVNLADLVRQSADLISVSLPKSTRLVLNVIGDELSISGNEALLTRLISNLCINASDALNGGPGEVGISVQHAGSRELERLRSRIYSPGERLVGTLGSSNDYACLRVVDKGGGISDADLDRIFEPFFTTKGRRHGTGLGLSVVHGVVESHGGACHVISQLGEGTIFSIYLPLRMGSVAEPLSSHAPQDIHGSERVLIVDDEQDIIDVLSIGLGRLGYETVGVTDPIEALAAFKEDPTAWDIVIADEMMPGMRGTQLVREIKSIRPDIKAVLCTGDASGEEISAEKALDALLLKPSDVVNIATKVRQLMDAHHS